jgi:SAM-dependent methyltransferase
MPEELYAKPRKVSDISECYFYHYMDLPGYGLVSGEWDLRGKEDDYLGNVKFQAKTVLEIGTASGHLCFYMEKAGAKVTAFDLSKEQEWDIVPYANFDFTQHIVERKQHIDRTNNAYWFAHDAYKSEARMVYGTVYQIPDAIGEFDICTFGSVLLHLRDPFLALQRASMHTRKTIVITDVRVDLAENDAVPGPSGWSLMKFLRNAISVPSSRRMQFLKDAISVPSSRRMQFLKSGISAIVPSSKRLIRFLPDSATCFPWETWWRMSPELLIEYIKILGFENTTLSYHKQRYKEDVYDLYTIVGHRKI